MALGMLMILFIAMMVISGLGIAFLFMVKNKKGKNILLYAMAIWAMIIAIMNATAQPSNFLMEQMIAWAIGFVAVIALVIKIKKPEKMMLAQSMVALSIVGGMLDLFSF